MLNSDEAVRIMYKTDRGGALENLVKRVPKVQGAVAPNLSGKRTERYIILLLTLFFKAAVGSLIIF